MSYSTTISVCTYVHSNFLSFFFFLFFHIWNIISHSIRFDPIGKWEFWYVCVCSVTRAHANNDVKCPHLHSHRIRHVIFRYYIYINLNWINCVKKNLFLVLFTFVCGVRFVFFFCCVIESILTCVEV